MGAETGAEIARGSLVELHLALTLSDGTEALSTFGEPPLRLRIGDGTLDPGLEEPLLGLGAGTGFDMLLPVGQAYGLRDEANIHWLPLADFPPELELAPGAIVQFTTPGGQELAGSILELAEERARVDFNHPLAGRELWYRVKILAVEAPPSAADTND
jgi:FKBP-type peptidyl-prolyl cis-trans isomerase SlpA